MTIKMEVASLTNSDGTDAGAVVVPSIKYDGHDESGEKRMRLGDLSEKLADLVQGHFAEIIEAESRQNEMGALR